LRSGEIDIVIGTHRLLQADVAFRSLGLVIIDEEHRFGVRQKERLKQLRQEVDILALTATPIPRTLNIGLAGLRAISLIGTPPPNRVSIKTFVRSFSMALVREACLREIHRGGQVYYLHNAVRTIGEAASRLADAVPEASIRIAHGQMPEIELERVMQDFYHQRFNILVCSTIIESGIDVPTANTIIINRADRLGLAQLHQLRGRVGRSRHQAYAFLLTPAEGPATTNAAKRLEAIVSLSQLGAGFTLASHDLEIRGAGELLGEGQSGAIDEIGFSLYTEYLTRAIRDLGQKEQSSDCWVYAPIQKPEINLEITALFPDSYLPDVHSRLLLYQRIAAAQTEAELYELQLEIVDRFGLLPVEVKALLRISVLQLRAAAIGIRTMEIGSVRGKLGFQETAVVEPIVMTDLLARNRANMSMSSPIEMRLQHDLPEPLDRLTFAEKLIGNLMGEDAEQVKLSEGLTHSERKR
jgi:transcription-repair coupling factor (superfamily II helicase)